MKIVTLVCPNCGAQLKAADEQEFCECEYCDSRIMLDVDEQNLYDFIDLPDVEPLLQRAYLFIDDGDFEKADEYLNRVLDLEPHCAKAYIGQLLCELRLRDVDYLSMVDSYLISYDHFEKALRFASGEEKEHYHALMQQNELTVAAWIRRKQAELEEIQQKIPGAEKALQEKRDLENSARGRQFWLFWLVVISFAAAGFFLIGVLAVPYFIVIEVPCVIWFVSSAKKYGRNLKLVNHYYEDRIQCRVELDRLTEKKQKLQKWLKSRTIEI